MLPDRVSNPGPLTYESGALPIALRGPAIEVDTLSVGLNLILKTNTIWYKLWNAPSFKDLIKLLWLFVN